jgi:hypothetical protein
MVQRFKKKKLNTLFVNGFSLLCCFGLIIRLSLARGLHMLSFATTLGAAAMARPNGQVRPEFVP